MSNTIPSCFLARISAANLLYTPIDREVYESNVVMEERHLYRRQSIMKELEIDT